MATKLRHWFLVQPTLPNKVEGWVRVAVFNFFIGRSEVKGAEVKLEL